MMAKIWILEGWRNDKSKELSSDNEINEGKNINF